MTPLLPGQVIARRVFAMGTVFNFRIYGTEEADRIGAALDGAERFLHWVDDTFSPYKDDSEVSRFDRGELPVGEACPEAREVIAMCAEMCRRTGGYFDAWATSRFDPSGIVKGWSIDKASDMLLAAGSANHYVEGGGDIALRGAPLPGEHWSVGVRHPLQAGAFCAALYLDGDVGGRAVATSGTYERGEHVLDPHTGLPATELASVTVVGRHLTDADAYATAALAMGGRAPDWLAGLEGYESQVVSRNGRGWSTPGFKRLMEARAA